MNDCYRRHQSHCQCFVLELGGHHIESEECILGEDDAVAGRETQNNCLHCDQGRRKEPRTRIGILQVYLDRLSLAYVWGSGTTFSPPDRGSIQPYSIDTASAQAARTVPTAHINSDKPTLPADLTMVPGVAKMPLPMTRETTRIYALIQVRCFRCPVVGRVSLGTSSEEESPGALNRGCRSLYAIVEIAQYESKFDQLIVKRLCPHKGNPSPRGDADIAWKS